MGRRIGAFVVAVVVNGLMTDWYRDIFRDVNIGDAMRNSFLAAFGATVIAVVIGALSGVALARHPGRWTHVFMLALVFLILVTPEIMDAISLGHVDGRPAVGRSRTTSVRSSTA